MTKEKKSIKIEADKEMENYSKKFFDLLLKDKEIHTFPLEELKLELEHEGKELGEELNLYFSIPDKYFDHIMNSQYVDAILLPVPSYLQAEWQNGED